MCQGCCRQVLDEYSSARERVLLQWWPPLPSSMVKRGACSLLRKSSPTCMQETTVHRQKKKEENAGEHGESKLCTPSAPTRGLPKSSWPSLLCLPFTPCFSNIHQQLVRVHTSWRQCECGPDVVHVCLQGALPCPGVAQQPSLTYVSTED